MNKKWRTKFSWSNSRQNLWDACKLAYYYNYIACWGNSGGVEGKEFRDRLWKLKRLTKLIFMKGQIIHKTCSYVLSVRKVTGTPVIDKAMKALQSLYDDEIKDAPHHFLEYVNGGGIKPVDFKQTLAQAQYQVENFYKEILPDYDGWTLVETEEFYRGMKVGTYDTTVVFDALFRNFEGLYLLDDFKTGKVRPADVHTSDQLTLYCMAVAFKYRVGIEDVIPRLAYLKSGEVFPSFRTKDQEKKLCNKIKDGASKMLAVTSAADFSPTASFYGCKDCNFLCICKVGKAFLDNNS